MGWNDIMSSQGRNSILLQRYAENKVSVICLKVVCDKRMKEIVKLNQGA